MDPAGACFQCYSPASLLQKSREYFLQRLSFHVSILAFPIMFPVQEKQLIWDGGHSFARLQTGTLEQAVVCFHVAFPDCQKEKKYSLTPLYKSFMQRGKEKSRFDQKNNHILRSA